MIKRLSPWVQAFFDISFKASTVNGGTFPLVGGIRVVTLSRSRWYSIASCSGDGSGLLPGTGGMLSLPIDVDIIKETLVKHIHAMTKRPEKADDFTTGQKLTLAAGIVDAIAGFLAVKENPQGDET